MVPLSFLTSASHSSPNLPGLQFSLQPLGTDLFPLFSVPQRRAARLGFPHLPSQSPQSIKSFRSSPPHDRPQLPASFFFSAFNPRFFFFGLGFIFPCSGPPQNRDSPIPRRALSVEHVNKRGFGASQSLPVYPPCFRAAPAQWPPWPAFQHTFPTSPSVPPFPPPFHVSPRSTFFPRIGYTQPRFISFFFVRPDARSEAASFFFFLWGLLKDAPVLVDFPPLIFSPFPLCH